MVVLDEATVGSVIQMSALIPAMEEALTALSAGTVIQPTRLTMPVAEHDATLRSMPACTGAELGAKLVTVFPLNEHVPTHHAVVVLFRPETGEPLAVMDGRLITEMRTAAVSAVATKLLARSRRPRSGNPGLRSPGAKSLAGAATRAQLSRGAHVESPLYVDCQQAAGRESGDAIAAGEIFAEIGEVLAGSKAGRQSDNEITLFKSVGAAVEDLVTAGLVYRKTMSLSSPTHAA